MQALTLGSGSNLALKALLLSARIRYSKLVLLLLNLCNRMTFHNNDRRKPQFVLCLRNNEFKVQRSLTPRTREAAALTHWADGYTVRILAE